MKYTAEIVFDLVKVEKVTQFELSGPKVGSTRFLFAAKEHPKASGYSVFCESVLAPDVVEEQMRLGRLTDDNMAEFVWNMSKQNAAMDMVHYAGQAGRLEQRVEELEAEREAPFFAVN